MQNTVKCKNKGKSMKLSPLWTFWTHGVWKIIRHKQFTIKRQNLDLLSNIAKKIDLIVQRELEKCVHFSVLV